MDPHIRWMRRHLASAVLRRLGWEAVAVGVASCVVGLLAGIGPLLSVPWALVAVHLYLALRLSVAYRAGALDRHALEVYIDRRLVFGADDISTDDDLSQLLIRRDLDPIACLRAKPANDPSGQGADDPVVDVFQSRNHVITVLRTRRSTVGATDAIRVVTKLADGRALLTTARAVPPITSLIVNHQPGASPTALLDTHTRAVKALASRSLRPITSGPELAVDLLQVEQEALAGLGPLLAPVLAPERRQSVLGVTVAVPPAHVRSLGLSMPIAAPHRARRPPLGEAA